MDLAYSWASAAAKEKWERLNAITSSTLDLNFLDEGSGQVSQQDDRVYFKRVVMSDVALLKIVKHASSNSCIPVLQLIKEVRKGRKEMGGLFKGKVCGDALVVMDACVLPVDDHLDIHSKLLDYFETQLQTGGLEDVVGWYRTSSIGSIPTETDISTQKRIQMLKDPSFALVIDACSTIDILRVLVQAFRTFPEGYTFPAHMNRKRNRPDSYLEAYPHLEKRYPLHVTYFKSSLGSNDVWETYWHHLISTPKTGGKTVGLEVSAENKENLGGPVEADKVQYYVHVKREFTKKYSSPTEAVDGLYVRLVKEVGSSESVSKISSPQRSFFYVTLTPDQAMKLGDHECVEAIRAVPPNYFSKIKYARSYLGNKYLANNKYIPLTVKILKCLLVSLKDDDAEAFNLDEASFNVSSRDEELNWQHKLCCAQFLDAKMNFLEAAQCYYDICHIEKGQIGDGEIDEATLEQALSAAVTCLILAGAGPRRSRVLPTLYKDERVSKLKIYPILKKVYLEMVLSKDEIDTFAEELKPHQKAFLPGKFTVLDRAMIEHNLLCGSKHYPHKSFVELCTWLHIPPEKAEKIAARMIFDNRMRGSVDH
ncbi:hypothetical protein KSS87_012290, partial [Heliosperma pusillum]